MTAGVIITVVAIMGLLFGLWWLADRGVDWAAARATRSPRPDQRIPAGERDLLGDDWREPVAGFFTESFIRSTRTRMAVYSACGADPYKSGRHGDTRRPEHAMDR